MFQSYEDYKKKRDEGIAGYKQAERGRRFESRRGEIDAVNAFPTTNASQIYHWTRGAGASDTPLRNRFMGVVGDILGPAPQNPFGNKSITRQKGAERRLGENQARDIYFLDDGRSGQRRMTDDEVKKYLEYQDAQNKYMNFSEADLQAAIDARNQELRSAKESEIYSQIDAQLNDPNYQPELETRFEVSDFLAQSPLDKDADVKQLEDRARSEMEEAITKIRRQNRKRGETGSIKEIKELQKVREGFQSEVNAAKEGLAQKYSEGEFERGRLADKVSGAMDEQAFAQAQQAIQNIQDMERQTQGFQQERLQALQQLGSGFGSLAGIYAGNRFGNQGSSTSTADSNFALNPYAFMGSIGGQPQTGTLQRYPYQGLLSRGG